MPKLFDTFIMGPLLRQYHARWEKGGENAALDWANSLSEDKQGQLAMEMQFFLADAQSQIAIATFRESVERSQQIIGFAKN